jgi:hypothetical protein
MATLKVTYRTQGPRSYRWGSLDEDIIAAGGRRNNDGTSTELSSGDRDVWFYYQSVAAAERARKRVKALGRLTRTRVS